eukprot:TRINITY_DN21261_c0_g1_i1.p1 TRINITY_DN21261_c0_g1~~TRINITY_DN21261_c0_g1_i1.p1  ORF type:complete len:218 (+),score=18.45 TRINITY_DN21261_c0_g1_i1:170-823(+)
MATSQTATSAMVVSSRIATMPPGISFSSMLPIQAQSVGPFSRLDALLARAKQPTSAKRSIHEALPSFSQVAHSLVSSTSDATFNCLTSKASAIVFNSSGLFDHLRDACSQYGLPVASEPSSKRVKRPAKSSRRSSSSLKKQSAARIARQTPAAARRKRLSRKTKPTQSLAEDAQEDDDDEHASAPTTRVTSGAIASTAAGPVPYVDLDLDDLHGDRA